MELPAFTYIALFVSLLGWRRGPESVWWRVGACLLWGSAVSFCCTPLFDGTAYARMRAKNHWTPVEFHAGNLVLHLFPLKYTVSRPPRNMRPADGVVAMWIHAAWGAWNSGGTFCMDESYVYMRQEDWHALWAIAWATEVATPLAFRLVPA